MTTSRFVMSGPACARTGCGGHPASFHLHETLGLRLRPAEGEADHDLSPDTVQLVAFVGATVVPMDEERVLPDHTVLVQRERIVALGPNASVAVPASALRIAAGRQYLIPGLVDMRERVRGAAHVERYSGYGSRHVEYLRERAARGSREKYEAVLAKVPDVEPDEYDRL